MAPLQLRCFTELKNLTRQQLTTGDHLYEFPVDKLFVLGKYSKGLIDIFDFKMSDVSSAEFLTMTTQLRKIGLDKESMVSSKLTPADVDMQLRSINPTLDSLRDDGVFDTFYNRMKSVVALQAIINEVCQELKYLKY